MLDYRFLYLMERSSNRSFRARLTFQREIKIGIAKDAKSRNSSVNLSIKGDVKILTCRKVFFAKKTEERLHRLFSDSRYKMKGIQGKRGGGLTEWFYLTTMELLILRSWLFWYFVRPWVYLFIASILTALFFKL